MARRRYLVAYDITDTVRLRRMIKVMEGFGDRVQYSVFVCDLSDRELILWRTAVEDVMNLAQDSVLRIDLGDASRPASIEQIGRRRELPRSGPAIL